MQTPILLEVRDMAGETAANFIARPDNGGQFLFMSIIIQTLEGPQLIVLTNLRIAHTYARRDSHALQLDYADGSILRIPISTELSATILKTINKQINAAYNS